ncbi:unnamed protein product [Cladocopium goreaui]|uniref:Ankyrin 2,3/unc44 n=1 Tax=Cladocopium goreaui TaxID=2562237 RepID=A0A9P1CM93_9DINO|nr:unnamed protein product [Cladocopium goreaui]
MSEAQELADAEEAARCGNDIVRAADRGLLGAVRHLLRTVPGAAAAKDDWGRRRTALHWAAGEGHGEICRVLLAAGAEVDARTDVSGTPLHEAADKGHGEICRVLLAAGAQVDARDDSGETPLHWAAAESGQVEVVNLLLEAKASVTVKDDKGRTPLDHARTQGKDEVVKILESAA